MRIRDRIAKLIVRIVIRAQLLVLPLVRIPALGHVVLDPRVVVAEELREVGVSGVVVCVVGLHVVAPPVVGWRLAVASGDAEGVACDAVFGRLAVLVFGGSDVAAWTGL